MTRGELDATSDFLETHNVGFTKFPFPRQLLEKIIDEHCGWFPIQVRAVPEASVVYPHIPIYTITAKGEFSGLVTYMESLLTMSWYPSTVATLSRRCRDIIEEAFDRSVDENYHFLIESRLHDFGFRACASVEQAIQGGTAHLLNFSGTDTLPAAYYSQYVLNEGQPVATSIPASEHSVMMAYKGDAEAMQVIIEEFGEGTYSIVMDTWNYERALMEDLPIVAKRAIEKGGMMVLRPDSGDPIEMTLLALRSADSAFGHCLNLKGFKVLNGARVIFGDGITIEKVKSILDAILEAGYSAQNIAFGMGSNLLHKLNRDTMSFATKVCFVEDLNGVGRDLAKTPKSDLGKYSLPGQLFVAKDEHHPIVHPAEEAASGNSNLLELIYDCGPISRPRRTFDQMRQDLIRQWKNSPRTPVVISPALQDKINRLQ